MDEEAATQALGVALERAASDTTTEALKVALLREAIEADIVLDLHSAVTGILHVVVQEDVAREGPGEALRSLAAHLGARTVLTVPRAAPDTFDEAVFLPRLRMREAFPAAPLSLPLAATVELRGNRDVSDECAAGDAEALLAFLTERGVVTGSAPGRPAGEVPIAASEALISVTAPEAGIVVLCVDVGDRVERGAVLADLVDPVSGQRRKLTAPGAGVVLITRGDHYAWRGASIAQLVPI